MFSLIPYHKLHYKSFSIFSIVSLLLIFFVLHAIINIPFPSLVNAIEEANIKSTNNINIKEEKEVYEWGFKGAGYHMQLEVEFPLSYNNVRISLNLPKAFFFDAAEVSQLYMITTHNNNNNIEITSQYTPLQINSTFFFDIEAPVFRVSYDVNSVNFTFAKLHSNNNNNNNNMKTGKGLLLIPIHARYEEADVKTPFSVESFFNREISVQRCIPDIRVECINNNNNNNNINSECYNSPALMKQYDNSNDSTGKDILNYFLPRNCQRIPIGILSSLPFVHSALFTLQCVGAAIIVLSLLWI